MKKILYLLLLLLISLLFTSCIDYIQSITYKDGKYQIYYKITLSKVLFAMTEQNPEEIFEYFDEESLDDLPENVYAKPVNTDFEVGAEFSLSIDPKTTDETEKSFLPKVAGQKCYIPFLLGGKDFSFGDFMKSDDSESQAVSEAILSFAKCCVMVSKKIISSINNAYFEVITHILKAAAGKIIQLPCLTTANHSAWKFLSSSFLKPECTSLTGLL